MTDADFEAARAQEAPQARLLRLAGLYDKLTDAARGEAYAAGRAKDAWTRTAIAAQAGTQSPSPLPGYAPAADGSAGPPTHVLDENRPPYYRELLEQCRLARPADSDAGASGEPGTRTRPDTPQLPPHPALADGLGPGPGGPGGAPPGLDPEAARAHARLEEWHAFLHYVDRKERELWRVFTEFDRDHDGRLNVNDIQTALSGSNIHLTDVQLEDLIVSFNSSRAWHASDAAALPSSASPDAPATRTSSAGPPAPAEVQAQVEAQAKAPWERTAAYITFPEFRDYLLLLPRTVTPEELWRFYQMRKVYGLFRRESGIYRELASGSWAHRYYHQTTRLRGGAGITSDGDSDVAGNMDDAARGKARKKKANALPSPPFPQHPDEVDPELLQAAPGEEEYDDEDPSQYLLPGSDSVKYLLAGGIAGGISRTVTAPFDRLKVFLITQSQAVKGGRKPTSHRLLEAARTLYVKGGGLRSFWVGNGLNVLKIFPESAIKFFSYETIKRAFAHNVDHVADSRDISPRSRFVSGGLAGICAQLSIYPVETVKTVMMSSSYNGRGDGRSSSMAVVQTVRSIYRKGGLRAFYRGLPAGLVGVFPYSAIDMSTFEGTKLAYLKATRQTDLPVYATLMIGSISGSVGAITVYPLNLVRTRLQASGTPAHPFIYHGFIDAFRQTYRHEGLRGFYGGLGPTLAKVIPAVSISYTVYEHCKKTFGVK